MWIRLEVSWFVQAIIVKGPVSLKPNSLLVSWRTKRTNILIHKKVQKNNNLFLYFKIQQFLYEKVPNKQITSMIPYFHITNSQFTNTYKLEIKIN